MGGHQHVVGRGKEQRRRSVGFGPPIETIDIPISVERDISFQVFGDVMGCL